MVGFESNKEPSPSPFVAAATSGRVYSFLIQLPDVTAEISFFLVALRAGKWSLPALYHHFRSEKPAFHKGTPRRAASAQAAPLPLPVVWNLCGCLPLPPASSISPVPLLGPTINENQEEGEWGLEKVIPSLFIGLHRGPGARSVVSTLKRGAKLSQGAGSRLGSACDPSCLNLPSCTIR